MDSAATISPALAGLEVVDKWSGLRPQAADEMPVLGTFAGIDDLYIATAHYRNGILLAPRTAEIMADAIVDGRDSTYLNMFGPDRFRTATARG
jgi:glycine oxidase